MSESPKKGRRKGSKPGDPIDSDFGPGPEPASTQATGTGGPIPGLACAGEGCLLKPVADLVGKFTLRLAVVHRGSLSRAAFSGIELMKALRDFLDEEIAIAERATSGSGKPSRYQKISVE